MTTPPRSNAYNLLCRNCGNAGSSHSASMKCLYTPSTFLPSVGAVPYERIRERVYRNHPPGTFLWGCPECHRVLSYIAQGVHACPDCETSTYVTAVTSHDPSE